MKCIDCIHRGVCVYLVEEYKEKDKKAAVTQEKETCPANFSNLPYGNFGQLYEKYEKLLYESNQKVIVACMNKCKFEEQLQTEINHIYHDFLSDLKSYRLGLEIKEE